MTHGGSGDERLALQWPARNPDVGLAKALVRAKIVILALSPE
jgi:hypothetical protein